MKIWTIGHSTHPIEEFLALLARHGITRVADVRTIPRSRHVPQYNRESLEASLRAEGIDYIHLATLGGLRHARPDSINAGWRNASFRGYADYMQTDEFAAGLKQIEQLATEAPTAVMCAEGVPWRCHRSLISDALLTRDWEVLEIMPDGGERPHRMTPFAAVDHGRITYPQA